MKTLSVHRPILIMLLALALVQMACGLGSQPTSPSGQQPPSNNGSPATQPPPAATSERGTPDEAKAMLRKAVEHYNSVGREKALADFNNKVPPFFDRDLYVVCIDSSLIVTANGGFPQYVGGPVGLVDAQGNALGKTIWDTASTTVNSVNYQWVNPVSGQYEPKALFFQKVGSDVCGVGAYNPK